MYNYVLRFLMEINIKIHVEQPAPPGVRRQHCSDERDEQTDKQNKTQHFWPPQWQVKSEPHQTWHGDRGPQALSCTSKLFGV